MKALLVTRQRVTRRFAVIKLLLASVVAIFLLVFETSLMAYPTVDSEPLKVHIPPPDEAEVSERAKSYSTLDDEAKIPQVARSYSMPADEAKDVFFSRPNWRRRARGNTTRGDDNEVRVMLAAFSTRISAFTCGAIASAYLSGLPLTVLGYGHNYNSIGDKVTVGLELFRKAGLRPQDVVMMLDDDLLFSDGPALVEAIDRFIAMSPESPEEIDVRAIRDGSGRMMAPFIVSTERGCWLPGLQRFNKYEHCIAVTRAAAQVYDAYFASQAPSTYVEFKEYLHQSPNTGFYLARYWALEVYLNGMPELTPRIALSPDKATLQAGAAIKFDDQAAAAAMYLAVRRWEVEVDVMSTKQDAKQMAAWSGPAGPYGLYGGMIALDHDQEFFFSIIGTRAFEALRVTDRYWRQENHNAVSHRVHTQVRNFVQPYESGAWRTGAAVQWEAIYGIPPADDAGALTMPGHLAHKPGSATKTQCILSQFYLQTTGAAVREASKLLECGGKIPTLPWRRAPFFYSLPLLRSRDPNVTSIDLVPPVVVVKSRRHGPLAEFARSSPILHFPGNSKADKKQSFLSSVSWYIPMHFDNRPRDDPVHAANRATAFLNSMPIELWGPSGRMRGSFQGMCGNHFSGLLP